MTVARTIGRPQRAIRVLSERSLRSLLVLVTVVLGLSCEAADDGRPPSCEAVGAHLTDVCMSSFFGEGVRLDCQVFGLDSATRRCLARTTMCADASGVCGLTNIVSTCSAASTDCPTPLVCDTAAQECVECSAALPCPAGKSCFGGVCASGP